MILVLAFVPPLAAQEPRLSKDALLTRVQEQTFKYFWEGADPHCGLAFERIHPGRERKREPAVAIGGSGFGWMALLVAVERGFISRAQAVERLQRNIEFLERAERFHGAWPHWVSGKTGKVIPFSKKDNGADLVETSFLAQGMLAVRQYLASGNELEKALAQRVDKLWRGIEWDWFTQGGQKVLYWHWSPTYGWELNQRIRGYNECLITYVLAASSPTHAIEPDVYHQGWAHGGGIIREREKKNLYLALQHNGAGENGGPLFWAHYSFLGLDPRGLKDRYADYWAHNRNHTLLNRAHCLENPSGYKGYGQNCWGLTASYSPKFYAAHSPDRDFGVISPTAALSSYPYGPDEVLPVIEHLFYDLGNNLWGPFGFYDAFSEQEDWVSDGYLAIDQGPIVVMIENGRTALLWNLFMSCPEVKVGLRRLGFESPHLAK